MNDYKTIKFNGNKYPYIELEIYDYDLNKTVPIKVGTVDLYEDIIQCLLSDDNKIKENAKNFDNNFKRFIPRNMLLKNNIDYITSQLQQTSEIVL